MMTQDIFIELKSGKAEKSMKYRFFNLRVLSNFFMIVNKF